MKPLLPQLVNLMAAILLLLAFAMLAQRRLLLLIRLYLMQGMALTAATMLVAALSHEQHLWYSALFTAALKVGLIPWVLSRLLARLRLTREVESLINVPSTLLLGIVLVVFAFNLAAPLARLAQGAAGGTLGIALACVLLSLMMMITRHQAVSQVIGFLAMENALFFAGTAATSGMPMVVELGIALDVLVGILILGVFVFQIRGRFDRLDLARLGHAERDA